MSPDPVPIRAATVRGSAGSGLGEGRPTTGHRGAGAEASNGGGAGRGSGRAGGGRWLSIHAACALLGVDQSTLRRWSDAGKVPVFRTPGGHRRYAEADLRTLIGEGARAEERPRVGRQALTDRSLAAYEEEYLRAARDRRWFRAYGPTTQEEHRRLGRRMVDLAVRFAGIAPNAGDRASLLDEARQIGQQYGRAGAAHGLSPSETVEAFLYYRYPVVHSVTGLIEEEGLAAKRAVRLFAEIAFFMDQVLVAMVQAHEASRDRDRDRDRDPMRGEAAPDGPRRAVVLTKV